MVVTKYHGQISLTVRGPETKATPADCPADAEFFGIKFRLGTFMPHLPAIKLVDAPTTLPDASSQSFWLHGSAWQFPGYDNADTFVDRLVRDGLLVCEPIVDAALQGEVKDLSLRSIQRRVLRATGLTQGTILQIERARQAMTLLQHAASIFEVVEQAGYSDQPHLTRSLKRLVGQTPAQKCCNWIGRFRTGLPRPFRQSRHQRWSSSAIPISSAPNTPCNCFGCSVAAWLVIWLACHVHNSRCFRARLM